MSDPIVPPPPGTDTPVPEDAPTIDVAPRHDDEPPQDALVPMTALEQRRLAREESRARAELQRAAPRLPPPAWQPPARTAVLPAGSTLLPDGRIVMPAPAQQPMPAYGSVSAAPVAIAAATPAYGGYPSPSYATYPAQPAPVMPAAPGYGYPSYVQEPEIPKRPFTKPQLRATLLGSLVCQTILTFAVHCLVTFFCVTGIFAIIQQETPNDAQDMTDSLAEFVSYWTHPDRYGLMCILAVIAFLVIAFVGWAVGAVWQRQVGLRRVHTSIALAWLTSGVITSIIGAVLWPGVLVLMVILGLFAGLASTTGGLWLLLFVPVIIAVLLCGIVGMLFQWLYLSIFRQRPTAADLEAERLAAEAMAEQQAQAADMAELARVEW